MRALFVGVHENENIVGTDGGDNEDTKGFQQKKESRLVHSKKCKNTFLSSPSLGPHSSRTIQECKELDLTDNTKEEPSNRNRKENLEDANQSKKPGGSIDSNPDEDKE